MNTKRILIYLAFAFGIPWVFALGISQTSLMESNPSQAGLIANLIFISTPWLANVVTRLITREGRTHLMLRPNFRRSWRFYLAVWWLPLLAVTVGGAIFYLLFPQSFDPSFGGLMKLVPNSPALTGVNPWVVLLSITLSLMIISAPINTIVSFGEEFGWRAYLLPKLAEYFASAERVNASTHPSHDGLNIAGARKASLLVGVIHGVWHWPLLIMSMSYTPGMTFITPLVYLVLTCSMSVLLSWATFRSGSVWTAAVGHAALNSTSALPGYLLKGSAISLIGPDPSGLIGGIGYTLLALVLFFSRKAFARMEGTGSDIVLTVAGVKA